MEKLEDEGLLRVSKVEIVQLKDPLYFTGLPILLIFILIGPIRLRVIVDALLLIE
mgnify:CR=1 FL=1